MPNTIQIMNYLAPYPGNFMRSVLALERRASICTFVFPRGAQAQAWVRALQDDGKNVCFAPGSVLGDARLLAGLIRTHGVRIIHSHFASARVHLSIQLARLACPGVSSVVHVHNHEPSRSRLGHRVKRALVNAQVYIGVSDDVHEDLITKGYPPERCVSVPNAVDFSRLERFDRVGADWAKGRLRVLMFGFDFERKGVDIALQAIHRHDAGRMALMIAVATNLETVRTKIEAMLGGVPEWVSLLPPRDDVASYYRIADVFVSPSREEGLPYALIEAAYCGVPIVASDIGGQRGLGIPHLIHFRSEDPRALYEALQRAAERRDARRLHEARDYVVDRFALEKWVEAILRVYARVESGGSARPSAVRARRGAPGRLAG